MLRRILVPLDGSLLAESAIPVAARLARPVGGTVILVRVYQAMPSEFSPELVVYERASDSLMVEEYLKGVAQRPVLADLPVETYGIAGTSAASIVDMVQTVSADTIVMTSHGRSGILRWMLGSVAEHVVRHATVPVFLLHAGDAEGAISLPAAGTPVRALVALDGSPLAEAALAPAAELARTLAGSGRVELRLVHVVRPMPESEDELTFAPVDYAALHKRVIDDAKKSLEACVERLKTGDLARYAAAVSWEVLEGPDVALSLMEAATSLDAPEERATFVAIATHGRGGLRRWALGSIAERVVEHTRLPILLVRPVEIVEMAEQRQHDSPQAAPAQPASGVTA